MCVRAATLPNAREVIPWSGFNCPFPLDCWVGWSWFSSGFSVVTDRH